MGKARRYDVSFIRASAILLVMLGHSIIIYSSGWNLYSTDVSASLFDHLKDMINVVQMPLFFSVSGFCLVYTVGPVGCRPVGLGVKARRLLIPFLVVGLLWMLPIRLAVGYPGYAGGGILHVVFLDLLLGLDNGHLWFLPTLFFMFLLVRVLQLFVSKVCGGGEPGNGLQPLDVLLPLFAIVVFIVCKVIRRSLSVPYLGQASLWMPYFAIGYLIHRSQIVFPNAWKKLRGRAFPRFVASLLLLAAVATGFLGKASGFLGLFASTVSLLAAYVLAPGRRVPIVEIVSRDSMGLYLFHSPLLYISFAFWPDIAPVLMFLVNFVFFGLVAALMTKLMRRVGLGCVIGE